MLKVKFVVHYISMTVLKAGSVVLGSYDLGHGKASILTWLSYIRYASKLKLNLCADVPGGSLPLCGTCDVVQVLYPS